jgi:Ulp1 family protease
VNASSRWTTSKTIDVFSKKCIFIPIHSDDHWSLFVALNSLLVPAPAVAGEYENWMHLAYC